VCFARCRIWREWIVHHPGARPIRPAGEGRCRDELVDDLAAGGGRVTLPGGGSSVAADPVVGLPRFRALAACDDRDVAWIVRENSKKARLAKLL